MSVVAGQKAGRTGVFGLPLAAFAAVLIGGAALLVRAAHGLTFSGDDLSFLMDRRGHDIGVFLRPHNEHLTAAPIFVFKALFALFGADNYWPFLSVALALHLLVVALVYVLAYRRVGPWAALAPAAILATLGPAWQDLLWAFQMNYFGSAAGAIAAFVALDRRDRTGDVVACGALVASLLWGSVGIGALAGVAVELALQRRQGGLRRLWIVAIPAALYGLWYVAYGASASSAHASNLTHVPRYVLDSLAASMAAVTGLAQEPPGALPDVIGLEWGRPLAVAAIALVVFLLLRRGRLTPRFWAIATMAVVLWAATMLSFGPGRDAFESRYAYVDVLLVLLAVVELARGWQPDLRALGVLAAVTVVVLISNVGMLDERARQWRSINQAGAAGMGAIEIARDIVDPAFAPPNLTPLVAGPYLSATAAFGSPAPTPAQIATLPPGAQAVADSILAQAERLGLQPVPNAPAGAACRAVPANAGAIELALAPGTLTVRASPTPATIRLRRFASTYPVESYALAAATTATLAIPHDRAARPWHVRIETPQPRLTLCVERAT